MLRSLSGSAPVVNAKPVRTRDYSVEIQRSGPAALPALYHNLHAVSVFLGNDTVVVREGAAGPEVRRFARGESSVSTVGLGCGVRWPSGAHCLRVHLHPRLVRRVAEATCHTPRLSLEPRGPLRDPVIRDIGFALWRDVLPARPIDAGAAHDLILALTHHVVGAYAAPAAPTLRLGRLSMEEIMDRFREGVSDWNGVEALAERAGLTRSHFTRSVRRLTGLSPYAMVAGSRIEAAKHLLEGSASLSRVAYRTGFADQSHLTRSFRRATGITPARYRVMRAGGPS